MSTNNDAPHSNRHENGYSSPFGFKRDGTLTNSEEQKELFGQAQAQEHEIFLLRRQITQAYIKEMQLLNEKYALERKFSDLRMAMDEKQKESITSALKEVMSRKADLEENLRLTNDLKDEEEQRYIFMTSLLGLLTEFGIWPGVTNASSISMNVMHLYDQLHQKLEENTRELRNLGPDQYHEDYSQPKPNSYQPTNEERSISSIQTAEEYAPTTNKLSPGRLDNDTGNSLYYDDGPGIEGFQITGEAIPGCSLLGCGYPVRGTTLCIFQWVRHLQDGTRHYIEGATNPEYVVTADDVDKCIAVECIPMDEKGRQGELVRRFANDQNKISCDPDMQAEIDSYISKGQANFRVLVLFNSHENWEEATFILRRSGFQVMITKTETVEIAEKFSENLSIKIPGGFSAQFVLTSMNGTSHPFRTYNDVRMRDTLVLTIRMFQSKALDDRKKGKGHL